MDLMYQRYVACLCACGSPHMSPPPPPPLPHLYKCMSQDNTTSERGLAIAHTIG